jgi:hypothetical protein
MASRRARIILSISVAAAGLTALGVSRAAEDTYKGSSFAEVWSTVKNEGPYDPQALPTFSAGFLDLVSWTTESIRAAAARTISTREDVLPSFQKLVHADGICLAGTWTITEDNPYSGYFAPGSQGLIIARISDAAGQPLAGDYRAFGFAGKIFPTSDATGSDPVETANFQTIDDLGGTLAQHFTDTALTNAPPTSRTSALATTLDRALTVAAAFRMADTHIGERQVYEISELGVAPGQPVHTPKWMLLRAAAGTNTVDLADFRNELQLENHGGKLSLDIFVASAGEDSWTRIGVIDLTDDALSAGCDHRLHFHHAQWRDDLR